MTFAGSSTSDKRVAWRQRIRRVLELAAPLPKAAISRLLAGTGRAPRFAGAYRDRAAANLAFRRSRSHGYDDENIADVSFDVMCQRAVWDYPVLFWLARLLPDFPAVLDAGGHLGTKYIAFSDLLELGDVRWTTYDLPGIVRAARARQAAGELPAAIDFVDRVQDAPAADILLGSGLLQYLDAPFPEFLARMKHRPAYILLNKVAVRDGPGIYTIERIGKARVPYQIRNRVCWESEIAAMGYQVLDSWVIRDLGHVIPTDPWLGRSESRGYVLLRNDQSQTTSADTLKEADT